MRKALVLCCMCLLLTSCAVIYPMQFGVNEEYLAHPEAYEVLGEAEGSSTISWFLIFPLSLNAGYEAAIKDALSKSGGDALINVKSDVRTFSFLYLYREVRTVVHGTAIKKK